MGSSCVHGGIGLKGLLIYFEARACFSVVRVTLHYLCRYIVAFILWVTEQEFILRRTQSHECKYIPVKNAYHDALLNRKYTVAL